MPGAEGAGPDDDDPAATPATATVQRTDLTETLTESGQLEYGDPWTWGPS